MTGYDLLDMVLGFGIAAGLLVYLTWALVHPEKF
jgi:K+-transporting ATPase KdpF subunit